MDIQKLCGTESGIDIALLINLLIDQKSTIDLDNLSEAGEKRFSDLVTAIGALNTTVTNLNTTVGTKLTATVKKAANGYIKFNNGVIIQWGQQSSSGGSTKVTLPTAYSSTNYQVVCVRSGTNTPTDTRQATIINYGTSTKTSFNLYFTLETSAKWITVGY